MKKLTALLLILHLGAFSGISQQQAPPVTPQELFGGVAPAPQVQQPPQAPPAAPAPQAPAATEEEADISLNLDNAADIYAVIRIIGGYLNLNYIIDPAVKGTINITTAGTLRKSDLLPILETILKINNATMVKVGNFYEIIPVGNISRQPLQVQSSQPATSPDDQMVLQIVRMKYVAASEMASLLNPYLGEGASIVLQGAGNILLITERRSNLRKLMEIIDLFDTNVFENERVRLLPVKNNLARDLVNDLQAVFSGYGQGTSAIRFSALDRISSILVVTPNPAVFPEVEKWLNQLDKNPMGTGTQVFVYKVKNTKADDIQNILSQVYSGPIQLSGIYNLPSPNPAAPGGPAPAQPQGAAGATGAAQPAAPAGTAVAAVNSRPQDVKIIADGTRNQIIVQATAPVYEEIRRTIEQLDILPRQVLIEAQIVQVGLDDSLNLGLSAALRARGVLNPAITTGSFGLNSGPPALIGQTFTYVGQTREIVAFLNASENRSRIRTLSTPSVMVSDNKSANFQVGAEVPVPTTSGVSSVQENGTNVFAQTITFRPTGVLLRVTPQINESGNVTLQIDQEVSEAIVNTTSEVAAPVISKTSVSSHIVVQDGQTIVLSGFIRENDELSRSRLPLLGRIPIAGILFGDTRKVKGRNELLILITPHVVRSHEEADQATAEMKAKLKEVQKVLK
jgi:general secretion pathway protein D